MPRLLDAPEPISRTASSVAAELIRQAILEGRLAPRERLKEEELARELGISRTPIREALLVLQSEGLVEASPNRGSTVKAYAPADVLEMYELRALLEGHGARRAATRHTPEQLVQLRESCARFESLVEAHDVTGLVAENLSFHQLVFDASGSDLLAGMARQTIALPLVYKSYIWYSPEQTRASLHYHRQLVAAFEHRDPDRAERIMTEHVLEARDLLAERLNDNGVAE